MDNSTSPTLTARLRRMTGAVASPRLEPALLAVTAAALTAGGIAWLVGAAGLADLFWGLGTVSAVVPAVGWVLAALRHGQAGVDLIAVLALGGTLAVGEYLAGALIALMLATGRTLEAAAQRRASRDLRVLLEHTPRSAHRHTDAGVATVPSADIAVDDLLVVGPGEVVPVDGRVESTAAVLDESVLTGEPLHVERTRTEAIRSGVVSTTISRTSSKPYETPRTGSPTALAHKPSWLSRRHTGCSPNDCCPTNTPKNASSTPPSPPLSAVPRPQPP